MLQSYFARDPPLPPGTPAVTEHLPVGQTQPGLFPTNITAYRQYLSSDFSYHLFYSSLYTKTHTLNILFNILSRIILHPNLYCTFLSYIAKATNILSTQPKVVQAKIPRLKTSENARFRIMTSYRNIINTILNYSTNILKISYNLENF